jgi:hypothetical protein
MKIFRWTGLYVGHLLTAVVVTAVITTEMERVHRPRTALGVVEREWILSIACAAVIGMLMFRTWKWRPALWVWILPGFWFGVYVLLTINRQGGPWYYLSGLACTEGFSRPGSCTEFFLATIPFIRTVAYSLGTLAGAYLFASESALLGVGAAHCRNNTSGPA